LERAEGPDAKALDQVLLLLIIAFGAALRLPGLEESFWLDEAATWLQTRDLSVVRTIVLTASDTYPPLHNLLTLPFLAVFGQGEVAYRLPSVVFGVLSIPATYWLGMLSGGRRTGLLAAVLMALAPFAIYFSQEARMYALLMLTSSLYAAAVLAWLSQPSRRLALAVIGSGAAMLYAHPYGFFALTSVGLGGLLVLIVDRAGWRRFLGFVLLGGAVLVTYLPWLFMTLRTARDLVDKGFWIKRPDSVDAFQYLLSLAGGRLGLGLLLAGLILALLPFAATRISGGPARSRGAIIVLSCLTFGPLLMGYMVSQITTPILVARYLICSLPALLVLAAVGYGRLGSSLQRLILQLALIGGLMVPAVAQIDYPRHPEDWRSLSRYLRTTIAPDDCLVTAVPYTLNPLRYYGTQTPECFFSSVEEAAKHADSNRWLIAVVSHFVGGVDGVKAALPGNWSPPLRFGNTISVIVRQPAIP
jgi:mannosyltransferase